MMLCQAAKKLEIKTIVLTDDKNGPAKNYCDEFSYVILKKKKIKEFALKADFVTLEFENFDYQTLKYIENSFLSTQNQRLIELYKIENWKRNSLSR